MTYLLIFLTIDLIAEKSGRSIGSSDQHFIIKLFTSQHDSFPLSIIGLNGSFGYIGQFDTN